MKPDLVKNKHLLWRAAFGPIADHIPALDTTPSRHLLKVITDDSSRAPKPLVTASGTFDGLVKAVKEAGTMQKLTQEQRRMVRKQSVDDLKSLNLMWLDEMVNSPAQLREKLSLFWHGHFACRVVNIYYQQELLHVIRKHALGNFGDLLREVSKSAAMLSFLNNQQNKKQHPNENFAREVMELFTMGRGNYTESDIRESARAFTGWGFNTAGEFVDRKNLHDTGSKTFLGRTGNFDGDDILNIILEQRATAYFISRKIYSFFVNEVVDDQHVRLLAAKFYESGYDIATLMNAIFTSDWFYDQKNIGTHIKSPVELIAGIRRMLPMELEKPEMQLLFQRSLGQLLFYPPNVAGWPGGKSWIDSSSLMLRLKLPQIMAKNNRFTLRPKTDDDVMMGREGNADSKKVFQMNAKVDWASLYKGFKDVPRADLTASMANILFQTPSRVPKTVLDRYGDDSTRENFVQSTMLELMSTPQYQLS